MNNLSKNRSKNLYLLFLFYVITLGFYHLYWLYINWEGIYRDNNIERKHSLLRAIVSIIPVFYLYYMWIQIQDIGNFLKKKNIALFKFNKLIATILILIFLACTILRIYLNVPQFMAIFLIFDLSIIIYIQYRINQYYNIFDSPHEHTSPLQIAHSLACSLIAVYGKSLTRNDRILIVCIIWTFLYVFSKKSKHDIDKQASIYFNSFLDASDICEKLLIKRNNHAYEDIKSLLFALYGSNSTVILNENEKKLLASILDLCKSAVLAEGNQSLREKKLILLITDKHQEAVISGILEKVHTPPWVL